MTKRNDRENKRASDVLTFFHAVFLALAIASVVMIVITQFIWEPDPKYLPFFHPYKEKMDIKPDRGAILDHNGKLLAMSTPMYDIYMRRARPSPRNAGHNRSCTWDTATYRNSLP